MVGLPRCAPLVPAGRLRTVRSTCARTPSRGRRSGCARPWRPPRSTTTSSVTTPRCASSRRRVAGLLGTDDALWTPTGSMGNLIALMSHLRRGDCFLAPAGAHVLDAELGTAAWLAGGMPRPLPHDAGPGKVSPGAVRRAAGSAGPLLHDAHHPAVPGEHPQRGGRHRHRPGRARRRRRRRTCGRSAGAPRRRAAVARRRRPRRPPGDADGRRGHRPGLLQQGARRPGRLRRGRVHRVRAGGAAAAQDARRRGPAGRRARRGGAGRAGPHGAAGRRSRARRGCWPRACASAAGPSGSRRPTSC